jgi:hypothetical protein
VRAALDRHTAKRRLAMTVRKRSPNRALAMRGTSVGPVDALAKRIST